MAQTPERAVKKTVVKLLTRYGAYNFYPVASGFGRSGIPDIVACYKGRFIAIECKAGKNTATELQLRELMKIRESGGCALVINENNIEDLAILLESIHD